MSDLERRNYHLSGELNAEAWQNALDILAGFGVTAHAIKTQDADIAQGLAAGESTVTIPDGFIPYRLAEIDSKEQYLADEHVEEFWESYRRTRGINGRAKTAKVDTIPSGLHPLLRPQPKAWIAPMNTEQTTAYAKRIGLEVVSPRSLVGFSDLRRGKVHSAWQALTSEYGSAVLRVGSFISFMHDRLPELPVEDIPRGIGIPQTRFFTELADKLVAQITTSASLEN